jgi:hypothetical protein
VIRVPKAYPVYDAEYRDYLDVVRAFVDGLENLQTVGRNGLHRYNNQDHAMLTGMLAVRNVTRGERHDLWSVNTDQVYHEEIRLEDALPDDVLAQAFARLDRLAFGVAGGTALGLALFVATLALVLRGGDVVGPNLRLLAQYFPGYRVTALGSALGLGYGFVVGFVGGWVFAGLRNSALFVYLVIVHRRAELRHLRRILEYL